MGAFQPTPIPLAGAHKFYTGQYGWGLVYLLLGATQVPRIACALEAVWYLVGSKLRTTALRTTALRTTALRTTALRTTAPDNSGVAVGETVEAVANGLREIEQLRQEGLLSEHEFEQKRRSLLEQMP